MRTFDHLYDPPAGDPVGATLHLSVNEIEAAGLSEVLQTPGTLTSWAILDSLLTQTGANTPFTFREPLGQSREVKVALSGLFGRFVARAYLSKHFNLRFFVHLSRRTNSIDRIRRSRIIKSVKGDYPDWFACDASLRNFTIAEAKGCHDSKGPEEALNRASHQAHRVHIEIAGKRAPVKYIAIATRWGFQFGGPKSPIMGVRDPDESGQDVTPEELDAIGIGIARAHTASMLRALGHTQLSSALTGMTNAAFGNILSQRRDAALNALDGTPNASAPVKEAELIGGVVTRSIPLRTLDLSEEELQVLSRIDLDPIFVGIDRALIEALIQGDGEKVRSTLVQNKERSDANVQVSAATWMVKLGESAIDLK